VYEDLRNDLSFFFLIRAGKKEIEQLNLVPVIISNCRVNLARNENYKLSITRMQQLSKKICDQNKR